MEVQVKLFAVAREAAGRDVVTLALPDGATVADLRAALVTAVPQLAGAVRSLLFAVDAAYAADDAPLSPGAEVACIPPVSGG